MLVRARWNFALTLSFAIGSLGNAHALAQVGADGIDWVTVGAVGNQPWQGNGTPGDRAVGRGGVNYEYKIGRFEVTTSQWVEFFNAAYDRPATDRLPFLTPPDHWGAVGTRPNTPGGLRWTVPVGREMYGVGDISWRMAAMYCNWLCNGKSADRSAFLNGAYDVSTFQTPAEWVGHNPNAQYWIPTWDEWLKAAHYDPNKNGPGLGGWWQYSTTSDVAPVPGLPGIGQSNTGGLIPSPFNIPLGSYTSVTSPWGLFDTAGVTSEWTDEIHTSSVGTRDRVTDGSWWSDGPVAADRLGVPGMDQIPNYALFDVGLRVASSVPSGNVLFPLLGGVILLGGRRDRGVYRCWVPPVDGSGPTSEVRKEHPPAPLVCLKRATALIRHTSA